MTEVGKVWVYLETKPGVFSVGHYKPNCRFEVESEHTSRAAAAARVNFLNGGPAEPKMPLENKRQE